MLGNIIRPVLSFMLWFVLGCFVAVGAFVVLGGDTDDLQAKLSDARVALSDAIAPNAGDAPATEPEPQHRPIGDSRATATEPPASTGILPTTTGPNLVEQRRHLQMQHTCGPAFAALSDPYGWERCLVTAGLLNIETPICGRRSTGADLFLIDLWAELDPTLRAPTVECVVNRCGGSCVTNHTAGVWMPAENHIEMQADSLMVLLDGTEVPAHGLHHRCVAVSLYEKHGLVATDEAVAMIGADCEDPDG